MAYTITQPSYTLYPSDNLSWSTAYSTDYAQPAFVYKFSVQVGATAAALATVSVNRVPVTPGSTAASFAPNAILRNYVTTPITFTGLTGPTASNDGLKSGRVIYGQEYNSGGTVVGSTGATGTTFLFWNSIFGYAEWPSYNQNQWIIGPTSVGVNFLTDGPASRCLIPQDLLYVNIADGTYGETYNQNQIFANWGASGGITYQPYPEVFQGYHDVGLVPNYQYEVAIYDDQYLESGNRTVCPTGGVGVTGWSSMIYQDFFTPTGSIINITLPSINTWATDYPSLVLFGCTNPDTTIASAFEQIFIFDIQENPLGFHQYYKTAFTATKTYYAFGLRFFTDITARPCSRIGPFSLPLGTWTVQTPEGVFWSITQGGVETRYPAYKGKQNWFNVGSAVRGGTADFTVQIENSGGEILSDIITFDADCDDCTACEHKSLTWLNSKGGYDTFQFYCVNNKTIEVSRTVGQQTLAQTYSVGDRGLYNTANIGKLRTRVNTNYVLPETVDWLESLMMSPTVYEVSATGVLTPVVVDTTTYQRFAKPNRLMVVEFEYTESNLRSSQIK